MTWKIAPNLWSKTSSTEQRSHLNQAKDSLEALLNDQRLNSRVKNRLSEDFQQLQRYLDKLERTDIHIAVFGRVSVGKSALLNALLNKKVFQTSVLHGTTTNSHHELWQTDNSSGIYLIDTPGIDEINGSERERIAQQVARTSDLILFVIDGDFTQLELEALHQLHRPPQPLIVVLNKADRLSLDEQEALLNHLKRLTHHQFPMVLTAADPDEQLEIDENGQEKFIRPAPMIDSLKELLWELLKKNGQSYSALNAVLFASHLSERLGGEIVLARQSLAEQIIHKYALLKALGVAINPVPILDLLVLTVDGSMLYHLSKIYNIEITKNEAQDLLLTIAKQTALLMGTVYGVHFLSSALKGLTGGLSTILTASVQGGLAFYGSVIIGKSAETYFAQGASWGTMGAKQTIQNIVADLDKEAIVQQAEKAIKEALQK